MALRTEMTEGLPPLPSESGALPQEMLTICVETNDGSLRFAIPIRRDQPLVEQFGTAPQAALRSLAEFGFDPTDIKGMTVEITDGKPQQNPVIPERKHAFADLIGVYKDDPYWDEVSQRINEARQQSGT